jgi:hypothetical protein
MPLASRTEKRCGWKVSSTFLRQAVPGAHAIPRCCFRGDLRGDAVSQRIENAVVKQAGKLVEISGFDEMPRVLAWLGSAARAFR